MFLKGSATPQLIIHQQRCRTHQGDDSNATKAVAAAGQAVFMSCIRWVATTNINSCHMGAIENGVYLTHGHIFDKTKSCCCSSNMFQECLTWFSTVSVATVVSISYIGFCYTPHCWGPVTGVWKKYYIYMSRVGETPFVLAYWVTWATVCGMNHICYMLSWVQLYVLKFDTPPSKFAFCTL